MNNYFILGFSESLKVSSTITLIGILIIIISIYNSQRKKTNTIKKNKNAWKLNFSVITENLFVIPVIIAIFLLSFSFFYLVLNSGLLLKNYGFEYFNQEQAYLGLRLINILALFKIIGVFIQIGLDKDIELFLSKLQKNNLMTLTFCWLFGVTLDNDKFDIIEETISADTIRVIDLGQYFYYLFAISYFWFINTLETTSSDLVSKLASLLIFLIIFIYDDWSIVSKYAAILKGRYYKGEVTKIRLTNLAIGVIIVGMGFSGNLIIGMITLTITGFFLFIIDKSISEKISLDSQLFASERSYEYQKDVSSAQKISDKHEQQMDKIETEIETEINKE